MGLFVIWHGLIVLDPITPQMLLWGLFSYILWLSNKLDVVGFVVCYLRYLLNQVWGLHTTPPYASMGGVMAVYRHSVTKGFRHRSCRLMHCQKVRQALFILLIKCLLQFSLLSSNTPKYLTSLDSVSSVTNSFRGLVIWFSLLLVNSTNSICSGLPLAHVGCNVVPIFEVLLAGRCESCPRSRLWSESLYNLRSLLRGSACCSGVSVSRPPRCSIEARTRFLMGSSSLLCRPWWNLQWIALCFRRWII